MLFNLSFGFSAGDFVVATTLIKNIISALNTSSASEYRELTLELHGLQRALDEIEHLSCPLGQERSLNFVKVVALMCQYPLDEFASKLKKFESLDLNTQEFNCDRVKTSRLKLQWCFTMKEEVQKLRAYLMVHVRSLYMRLGRLNL